jgi:hypothetical protein
VCEQEKEQGRRYGAAGCGAGPFADWGRGRKKRRSQPFSCAEQQPSSERRTRAEGDSRAAAGDSSRRASLLGHLTAGFPGNVVGAEDVVLRAVGKPVHSVVERRLLEVGRHVVARLLGKVERLLGALPAARGVGEALARNGWRGQSLEAGRVDDVALV